MDFNDVKRRGLVMLGCGKMGSAMLEGWLSEGLPPEKVWVIDPFPADWLAARGVQVNADLPTSPAVALVAVKPQMMAEALPALAPFGGGDTLILSVAAGTPISYFEEVLGTASRIIRAMPNTPAAIGQGITAIIGNAASEAADVDLAAALLSAIGEVVKLDTEDQIDAVTGVSGSGPAYIFYMIDALAAAARAEGLPDDMAMQLAKATVAGAGALAMSADETPEQLRINVTSPNGTTQAGLEVLMDAATGLTPLIEATVGAAAARSRELKG
ncbi:pyrroline-5-carboxylate reductase [Roseobacter sp. HKCCD9010]|uniref:pyrroline-5-carboxylate reductase n=1 Tax=unclassified Roseobacter TaxID=196798 RepID=UPI001491768F|nr:MULTISPECIES: pyrroline-5-carboxylate reductase [unclassified Roseobacter]MBF9051267.1 pyrroline-5-carboxylate reductase [Rhodobacterales bacterium HKCCD4356]NNV13314.1 pyrroline-5-carboxylate reductase [Roseobacter sp. HKCCD7357]NNV17565.1 pyrroline-5-carboxylate reductase [Roseobacter sp. HKCCD8768]NNV27171.1 pyrroline-5-carboxylate reductase [Roseobacter sp. HKCCD8192]NNV31291.1 pyrroline-5-carboxylate reductase [Roseobacter sp. HKCCD9061]